MHAHVLRWQRWHQFYLKSILWNFYKLTQIIHILCFLPLTRIHKTPTTPPPHIHTHTSMQPFLQSVSKTHTRKHTQTPFHLRAHIEHERKKCTVILHNKSPAHVFPLHSLWANKLFRASISSSVHRKHVSPLLRESFVVKKAKLFYFSFFSPPVHLSILLCPETATLTAWRPASQEDFSAMNSKDCHRNAGMSYYNLCLDNGVVLENFRKRSQESTSVLFLVLLVLLNLKKYKMICFKFYSLDRS